MHSPLRTYTKTQATMCILDKVDFRSRVRILIAVAVVAVVGSCSTQDKPEVRTTNPSSAAAESPFGGLSVTGSGPFLVVHHAANQPMALVTAVPKVDAHGCVVATVDGEDISLLAPPGSSVNAQGLALPSGHKLAFDKSARIGGGVVTGDAEFPAPCVGTVNKLQVAPK